MLDDNAVCPLCGEPAKAGGDVMQWGVYANVNMRYWWVHLQCAIWAGEAAERVRRAPPFEMSPNESDKREGGRVMQLPAFVSIDEDGDLFIELVHPTTRIHITIPENGNGAWAYIGSKPWALHHGSLGNETQEVLVALVEDLIKATASERE